MRRLLLGVLLATLSLPAAPAAAAKRWGSLFGPIAPSFELKTPTLIEGLSKGPITAVDASNASAYALRSDGTEWALGDAAAGELGNGTTTDTATAVQVKFPPGTRIVSIGEAKNDGYAIDSTGQGWAWGHNGLGSLCIGNTNKQLVPVEVPGVTTAIAVQGGENHVLWLMADGTVRSCGTNENGQLGLPAAIKSEKLATEVPGLSKVVEISAGDKTSAARTASGEVFLWGDDENGQVGNGTTLLSVYKPFRVPLPGPASQVSAGGNLVGNGHTLALVDGVVYGWGRNKAGQVGDGTTVSKTSPVNTGRTFSSIVASGCSSLGLDAKGTVSGWGCAQGGDLGSAKGTVLTSVVVDTGAVEISGTAYDAMDR